MAGERELKVVDDRGHVVVVCVRTAVGGDLGAFQVKVHGAAVHDLVRCRSALNSGRMVPGYHFDYQWR